MPTATSLLWQFAEEKGETKNGGKIDIHLKSIFVNGVKRGRISDLSEPPSHDGFGGITVRFSCGGHVKATLLGGRLAAAAFVEDCAEALQRQTGKRKFDAAAVAATGAVAAKAAKVSADFSGEQNVSSTTEIVVEGAVGADGNEISSSSPLEVPPDDASATGGNPAPLALAEVLDEALCLVDEASFARPFLEKLRAGLQRSTSPKSATQAVLDACEQLQSRTAEREEKHLQEKKALRVEVSEIHCKCERVTRGREGLEKQLKVLLGTLNLTKEQNSKLESQIRGERAKPPPGPSGKRSKARPQQAGAPKLTVEMFSGNGELVRSLAEVEVSPLLSCDAESREALKKRILLKWHPDKQPSEAHKSLATEVMQELQNRPEWAA